MKSGGGGGGVSKSSETADASERREGESLSIEHRLN